MHRSHIVYCVLLLCLSNTNAQASVPKPNDELLTGTMEVPDPSVSGTMSKLAPEQGLQSKLPSTQTLASVASKAVQDLATEDSLAKESATPDDKTPGFGPHLLTDPAAVELAKFADVIESVAVTAADSLGTTASRQQKQQILPAIPIEDIGIKLPCPFASTITCPSSPYRSPDGSCNNLQNPWWGKALTPFERFLPPFYDNAVSTPRSKSVNGGPLPKPRTLSFKIHDSLPAQSNSLSHFTMQFGQFVSHDIQMNALSKGYLGGNLDCCGVSRNHRNCLPIDIPADDPFFLAHGTKCINFVRALNTPSLDCKLDVRQQLNQVTHYLDGSSIYGSDKATQSAVRTFTGGRLKVTNQSGARDLPPKDPSAFCLSSSPCFKTGDVRSNQQPLLMSLHTIWLREHNRIAKILGTMNAHWNDEKIFQETRRIVIAELQHVTYNEYLPLILGSDTMTQFGLSPLPVGQYFTGYNSNVKPMIRNEFAAAAYRFGHSMVRDNIKSSKLATSSVHTFRDVMLKSDLVYNQGVSELTKGMYQQPNYQVDRYMTFELTRHLFQTANGNGIDLAAANINRGRDHGTADYNTWRQACGFSSASGFGNLDHHTPAIQNLLQTFYSSVFDIDLFTGGTSETLSLPNAAIGPVFACIVGLQFKILKLADRFFYESNTNVKFTLAQLDQIKKVTMAKIICDVTDLTSVPANVFKQVSASNPEVSCSSLASMSLNPWNDCTNGNWGNWGPWSSVKQGCTTVKTRTRKCDNPTPSPCGQACPGEAIDRVVEGSIFDIFCG